MHIIDLKYNVGLSLDMPLPRVAVFTGSALPLAIRGVPEDFCGDAIAAVSIALTNADGARATVACERKGSFWTASFAASFFAAWGLVSRGVRISAVVGAGESARDVVLGCGDLDIVPATPDCTPGDPAKNYQTKGGDIYLKTSVVDGVQHYTRQALVYDADMGGWGLVWSGDYILVNGDFVEV